jgi:antitoxin ParD1/3/4
VALFDIKRHTGYDPQTDGKRPMARSLNLSLTDELRAFLDANSGDGTLYSTPSEFVRALIREKKERLDAAALRQAILEGYDDVLHGRTHEFTGDLRAMLAAHRARAE